jgi:uncharacterized protein YqgC (DUF456 family)
METLLVVAALVAVALGLAGIVLPLLPGVPLIFAGLWLLAWTDDFAHVSETTTIILAGMAVVAWLVDYVAAALGVKRAGASSLAVAGAAIGAAVGLLGGLVGIIIGPILGAVAGEWLARRNRLQAAKAGIAAGIGFLLAVAAKIGIAFTMIGMFAFAWFA